MDPSTQPVQNTSPMNRVQAPVTPPRVDEVPVQTPAPQSPTASSTNKETGPAAVQEVKPSVTQEAASIESQTVELQPSIPEAKIEKSMEQVLEKSPDQEKPVIPPAVKAAGVTHSGPGVIDVQVQQNGLIVKPLPATYAEAALEEKKTEFKSSKHWLMGTVMYVWRKINPELGKEKKNK